MTTTTKTIRRGRQVETVTTVVTDHGTFINNVRHYDAEMTQDTYWREVGPQSCTWMSKAEFLQETS